MNSISLHPRLRLYFSRLSSLLLLLQRSPIVQLIFPEAKLLGGAAATDAVKLTIATVIGLGAFDSVAGATTFSVTQNTPTPVTVPVSATVGIPINFSVKYTDTQGHTPGSWQLVNTSGTTSPAVSIPGLTHANATNNKIDTISGSPTVAGDYSFKFKAWENTGYSGAFFLSGIFTIRVAAGASAPVMAVEQPLGTPIADAGSKSFGTVAPNTNNDLQFTIKNTGNADLTGLTITKDGTDAADFTIFSNPAAPVSGPSGTTTFTVRFAPTTLGSKTAAIHIANNDTPRNPYDINLTGTVFAPVLVVEQPASSPLTNGTSTVSFGTGQIGVPVAVTFTLKNNGNATLSSIVLTKDGTHNTDYAITTPPPSSLLANSSGSFVVTFTPSGTGSRVAALRLTSNDTANSPFIINLEGTGTAPLMVVEQVTGIADGGSKDFGSVLTGSNTSLVFTIKNTGFADLTGLAITKDGSNPADFTITANPVAPVSGPDRFTTFTVQFAPAAIGTRSAVIHIASNDTPRSPFDITLTGTGTAAQKPFDAWMSTRASGVPANQRGALQTPQGDGVCNLLKFAFNMDPNKPDTSLFVVGVGDPAGLPRSSRVNGVLKLEYIRRKAGTNPGLTYTPQCGSDMLGWNMLLTGETITPIGTTDWERVTLYGPAGEAKCVGRVKVVQAP